MWHSNSIMKLPKCPPKKVEEKCWVGGFSPMP